MGEETCCNPLCPSGVHSCLPYEEVYCVCVSAVLPHWREGNKKGALLTKKMKGATGSGDKRDHCHLEGSVNLSTGRCPFQGWRRRQTRWSSVRLSVVQFSLLLKAYTDIRNRAEIPWALCHTLYSQDHKPGIWSGLQGTEFWRQSGVLWLENCFPHTFKHRERNTSSQII